MRLDAVRGLFLIIMAGVHVPSPVSTLLREPFGFVSAAEGFIFLSGCLAGLVYGKVYLKSGWETMTQKVWRRSRLVFIIHLALLLPVTCAAWIWCRQVAPFANHFHDFLLHPWTSLPLMPLLLHQPPLFDILPMYVLFLLATPLAFATAKRRGWHVVLLASAALWLAGQFQSAYFPTDTTRLLPFRGGSFNVLAWQFLWMAGLAFGESSLRRPVIPQNWRRPLGALAATIVLIGLCARHGIVAGWQINPNFSLTNFWLNKWTLGPMRLLNFFAWVILLLAWNPRPPARLLAPTALLGRHSLGVFAFHLPMVITATAVIQMLALPAAPQTVLALGVIGSLFIWAWWLEENARERARAAAHPDFGRKPLPWLKRLHHHELVPSRSLKSPPADSASV